MSKLTKKANRYEWTDGLTLIEEKLNKCKIFLTVIVILDGGYSCYIVVIDTITEDKTAL